ncbi:hypothetical protein K504DRAFT_459323 [Pleomassaria siparia CBS 279.74]|uniref:Uncharacterized protein n=1 Tax=Pleomassaria siparia CBS 279.74 TaxID=1314801 RepID=A0A6G1K2Q8_9PLEO|nr:hypothetical protein K504DRAFT_459323 [Pleomassaria siparia CBS 279.74]
MQSMEVEHSLICLFAHRSVARLFICGGGGGGGADGADYSRICDRDNYVRLYNTAATSRTPAD